MSPLQPTPPTVLCDFLKPGFPFAGVFSVFFVDGHLLFAMTGNTGTNAAGTLRGSLGSFTPSAMIAGAVGALWDTLTGNRRTAYTVQLGSQRVKDVIAADKHNYSIPLSSVRQVQIHGPNMFGELKIMIAADKVHKFRVDKQTEASAQTIAETFDRFLAGKVLVRS